MYHPYFRGRQYELIAIRESAPILAEKNFVPIIEPVKERFGSLRKTLDSLCEKDADVILIMNPHIGDHSDDNTELREFIDEHYGEQQNLIYGLLLVEKTSVAEAIKLCKTFDKEIALIHAGFSQAKKLSEAINGFKNIDTSIFFEGPCGKLYQRHFVNHSNRILIRDGFERRRNKDYPPTEFFSDLHETFKLEEGMDGFGDFLIVGDEYSENGGPAYTVAIHLTYIDSDKDNEMHIRHFKSDRQNTPRDPAGKFAEALEKLISALNQDDNKILETDAVVEFQELHKTGHYPGLGYVKKLSMKHHIETLAKFFDE